MAVGAATAQQVLPPTDLKRRSCENLCLGDKRSESNGWCARAGDFRNFRPSGLLVDLRAGTPRFLFGPLVTPYEKTHSRCE